MKKTFLKISAILIPFFTIVLPAISFGQIENPLGHVTSIPVLVSNVMSYVVKIGGVVAVFAFIFSGYLFVQAQGKPAELDKAKTVFINTCIGVAILLGAQLIASIIVGTIKSLKS